MNFNWLQNMFKIEKDLEDEIISYACDRYPQGVCGVLAGEKTSKEVIVEDIYPCKNRSESPASQYLWIQRRNYRSLKKSERREKTVWVFITPIPNHYNLLIRTLRRPIGKITFI